MSAHICHDEAMPAILERHEIKVVAADDLRGPAKGRDAQAGNGRRLLRQQRPLHDL